MAPMFLDYTVNDRILERNGNRLSYAAPHGVYRCKGEDAWCALAVFSDEEWQGFCEVLGNPGWTQEERFSTLLGRVKNVEELDKLVEDWTATHTREEIMTSMQAAGVPAGMVNTGEDVWKDPQLKHLNALIELEHPDIGTCFCEREGVELSKTHYTAERPALLGEHTQYVCGEILGMSDEDFVGLLEEGVFD